MNQSQINHLKRLLTSMKARTHREEAVTKIMEQIMQKLDQEQVVNQDIEESLHSLITRSRSNTRTTGSGLQTFTRPSDRISSREKRDVHRLKVIMRELNGSQEADCGCNNKESTP